MTHRGRLARLLASLTLSAAGWCPAALSPPVFQHAPIKLHLDSGWGELFAQATNVSGAQRGARDSLASHYDTAGYTAPAAFLRSQPGQCLLCKPPQTRRWYCPEPPDAMLRSRQRAQQLADLVLSGNYMRAVEEARRALDGTEQTCQLLVQWASAVLYSAMSKGTSVTITEQEAAVRLLLTGVEDLHVMPVEAVGPADVYSLLSYYFASRGDWQSAYAGVDIALDRLEVEHRTQPSRDVTREADRLRQRKENAFKKLQESHARKP